MRHDMFGFVRVLGAVVVTSSLLLTVQTASAQATSAASGAPGTTNSTVFSPPQESTSLDEILVTAQKRSQSVDTVGMAITAVTGDQLKMQQVTDVAGLTKIDPSFVIAQGNWGGIVYAIRGVGYNDFSLSANPDVSVYSDEVPYAYPYMSKGATFDLDRVEVLKGPQGTLYGQNATGGAVNYVSAKPTDTFEAGVEATYARFNAVNLNGFVSGPITDTLKARLSFDLDEGGAWQESYTRNDSLGNKDNKFGRLLLDWTPTDKLKVAVNLNGWTDNSQTQAGQLQGVFLGHPAEAAYVPSEVYAPVAPQNAQAADWLAGTHPANDESYYQGSIRAEYTVSNDVLLTYIGSYEAYHQDDLQEPDGMSNLLYLLQGGSVRSDSQELRASGNLFDDKVIWLVGGEYANTVTNENDFEEILGDSTSYALAQFNNGNPWPDIGNVSTDDSRTTAGFANIEYHPSTELDFHVGGRYTQTDITHTGCTKDTGDGTAAASFNGLDAALGEKFASPILPGGCITTTTATSDVFGLARQVLDQDNVSWRAGTDWTPIEHTMFYVSVSQGYKAGNFPTAVATSFASYVPVVQESLLSYESGVKTRFLDNRVAIDADVFYYDYTNQQFDARVDVPEVGTINKVVNIPKSKVTGSEFAVKIMATSNLVFTFRGTYLDTEVTEGPPIASVTAVYGPLGTAINLKGEPFPNAPKWSFNADSQYTWDLNDRYSAYIGMDGRYQTQSQGVFGAYAAAEAGEIHTAPPVQTGNLTMINDAYGVADIRAGIQSRDGHWRYQVFGNNVTNAYYWNQTRLEGEGVVRFSGMPFTYGVTVGYRY
jgi:iron complex outermembrane recepter protein